MHEAHLSAGQVQPLERTVRCQGPFFKLTDIELKRDADMKKGLRMAAPCPAVMRFD